MPVTPVSNRMSTPVSAIREPRPAACPRCGSARFKRNGLRHTVQLYVCHACRRSFNTRTGTPLARRRRPREHERFRRRFDAVRPLREDANALGVSVATVWKWRHERLAQLVEQEEAALPVLAGAAAIDPFVLKHSSSHWCSPAHCPWHRRPKRPRLDSRRDYLFFVAEVEPPADLAHLAGRGQNRRMAFLAPETVLSARELGAFLADRLAPGSWADTVRGRIRVLPPDAADPPGEETTRPARALSKQGSPRGERGGALRPVGVGKSGRRALWERIDRRGPQGPRFSAAPARELRRTFIQWMKRFRGVSLRYLDWYVAWFNAAVAAAM